MENNLSWQDFEKVEMRIGTILEANDFPEARKPAYQLTIDFGKKLALENLLHKSQSVIQKKL